MHRRSRTSRSPGRSWMRAASLPAAVATTVVLCATALSGCSAASTPTPSATARASAAPRTAPTTTPASPTSTTPSAATSAVPTPDAAAPWPGYHADPSRTGAVAADPSLDHLTSAWRRSLGAVVHNEPVVADGRIVVADESDRVTALSPANGSTLWSVSLGDPLKNVDQVAGCGDIDPLGITSTPVVDPRTDVVYVVGEVETGGASGTPTVRHRLEGISIATGRVVLSETVDPPLPAGESAAQLLQRASLALANGRVYVAYAGNDGDCGSYHGWVVAVDETGAPHQASFEVASDGEGGAIWESGGAPAVDAAGDVYVTTGNANPDPPQGGPDPKRYTESAVKLSPALQPLASFKDRVAGGDEDLSTGNPVLLPHGDLFVVGKTDVGYVLRQSDLAKVAEVTGVCGSNPDGGPAYDAALGRLFVPCRGGGIQEVDLRWGSGGGSVTETLGSRLSGANSAPVLVGQRLWALEYPSGSLTEYDAATGARVQTTQAGTSVPNFASPTVALGLLLVGTNSGVAAFHGAG